MFRFLAFWINCSVNTSAPTSTKRSDCRDGDSRRRIADRIRIFEEELIPDDSGRALTVFTAFAPWDSGHGKFRRAPTFKVRNTQNTHGRFDGRINDSGRFRREMAQIGRSFRP